MRKALLAAIAVSALVPTGAMARDNHDQRHDQREIRHDQREIRHDQRELRHDRHERREDWRDYRKSNRNVYRREAYRGPRGYRYRPISVGYRFAPAYYSRGYWINNYDYYRLPPPGHGRRWVRYGNDVVLINISNGITIRVLNGFFW